MSVASGDPATGASSCRVDDVELYESPDERTLDWLRGVPGSDVTWCGKAQRWGVQSPLLVGSVVLVVGLVGVGVVDVRERRRRQPQRRPAGRHAGAAAYRPVGRRLRE